jgi:fibronectin type 3 domain-containing protein
MYQMDQYTVSLLHFNGGLIDESGKVWTANGGVATSTAQSKFGGSSLRLNGSGQYLTTPNSTDFDFGSGDFTIDWWEYRTGTNVNECCVAARSYGTPNGYPSWLVGYTYNNVSYFYLTSNGSSWDLPNGISLGTIIPNTWVHYAVARHGNTIYTFQNGNIVSTATFSGSVYTPSNYNPAIGSYESAFSFNGYIDEFRISKGIARWTSSFTPPSEPNVPTNLIAIAGDSQVTLSWTAITGAASYNIKRSTTAGGPYTTITINVTGTSYIDNAVTSGTTYYYVVTAVDGSSNESANSNGASATPIVSAPTNLTATAGNSQVALSWGAVSTAIGYNVKRSTTAGGPYAVIASNVSTNSYVDSTVTNGTTYYYVVTAVDGSSNESANSHGASATPIVSAPINLTATAGNSQVALSWGAVSTAIGYNVKRSTTAGGPYAVIASNVSTNSYVDSTVTNGTTYYYVVTAVDGSSNESANSNGASAVPIVSAPINLTATAGNSQVALSWGAVSTAIGYNVKRSTTAGGPYAVIASNVSTNSYVDSTVTNGTTYYYVVTALSGNSESVNSNEASATAIASIDALLRVIMNGSSEREFQLSSDEIEGFINWVKGHVSTDPNCYMLNKIEVLQNSKEYLMFEKIISFEVMPLTK